MTDRPVSLDLHVGLRDASRMTGGESGMGTGPDTPDPALLERFAAALTAEAGHAEPEEGAPQTHRTDLASPFARPDPTGRPEAARTPFALLASLGHDRSGDDSPPPPPSALPDPTREDAGAAILPTRPLTGRSLEPAAGVGDSAAHDRSRLLDAVVEVADRILIDDGQHGRREVRVELADTVLPGVTVSVYQQHGEWVADFDCSDPQSYAMLAEPAPALASELADQLRTPARWRVKLATDPQTVVEAAAQPFEHSS